LGPLAAAPRGQRQGGVPPLFAIGQKYFKENLTFFSGRRRTFSGREELLPWDATSREGGGTQRAEHEGSKEQESIIQIKHITAHTIIRVFIPN